MGKITPWITFKVKSLGLILGQALGEVIDGNRESFATDSQEGGQGEVRPGTSEGVAAASKAKNRCPPAHAAANTQFTFQLCKIC